jgi:hypothetical protein
VAALTPLVFVTVVRSRAAINNKGCEKNIDFPTTNLAPFVENIYRIMTSLVLLPAFVNRKNKPE